MKLRLGANEDVDSVKLRFIQAGYSVQDYEVNTKK
jgi:hypothetical protein